jgi:ankyrin repeat protein
MKLLIDNGIDIEIKNIYGDTALLTACRPYGFGDKV